MGREKREISDSGIYHIYFCGINKQKIFCDDEDRECFISVIVKNKESFELFSYCLLNTSVNLLVKEKKGKISEAMQKILTRYASYFNRKYKRSGSLFENRYKSMPIKNDEVFDAVNFIHKIPSNYKSYKWSSYSENSICDIEYSDDFYEIHKKEPDFGFDLSDMKMVRDRKLIIKLKSLIGDLEIEDIKKLSKKERDDVLKMLRENGFTIGQLMRFTGISRSVVTRSNQEKVKKQESKEMQVFLL